MSNLSSEPIEYIHQIDPKPSAAYIFFHGAGTTGKRTKDQFLELMGENYRLPHVKFVFPTAPNKFFRLQGKFSHIWFNAERFSDGVEFDYEDLDKATEYVESLIQDLESEGIPRNRIAIGGWSQGGMMAMYAGFTKIHDIAAIAVISSVFPFNKAKINRRRHPILLICNNDRDTSYYSTDKVIEGIERLQDRGVRAFIKMLENDAHDITPDALRHVYNWIQEKIPKIVTE